MIIVTGTKRSGTSMWMQILSAAGLPLFGEAFPRNWGQTLRQANPGGFYESILRRGIYWRTNPHPRTGAYFFPEQVERHAVKVFIPGLVRTDRAFIGKVIASMRSWREYVRSLRRLWAMEDAARLAKAPQLPAPPRMAPALEWWSETYMLLRDVATRRYPIHLQSYDGLLSRPDDVLAQTFAWLGIGDAQAALAAVKPELRTQRSEGVSASANVEASPSHASTSSPASADPAPAPSTTAPEPAWDEAAELETQQIDPSVVAVFDRLYATIDAGQPVRAELLTVLNETHAALAPRIVQQQRALTRAMRRQRAHRPAGDDEDDDDALDDDEVPSW